MEHFAVNESAMSDSYTRHLKADDYVFRMPTPPRIVIPPLGNFNYNEAPHKLGPLVSHPDPAANIDFLADLNYDLPTQMTSAAATSWKYEHRRQAQEILPFLWLGPLAAARDKDFLQRESITMVLSVQQASDMGARLSMGAMRVAEELGLAKATLEASHNQDLIGLFPTATNLINSHLREMYNRAMLNPAGGLRPGKVLIFCESGNEKSAAVAAAYLMDNFANVNYVKACQTCNARRFCCSFDDGVKFYLKSYDDILQAKRTVAASTPPVITPGDTFATNPLFGAPTVIAPQPLSIVKPAILGSGKPKRGRERDEDEMEVDETATEDEDRFAGRTFAPFR